MLEPRAAATSPQSGSTTPFWGPWICTTARWILASSSAKKEIQGSPFAPALSHPRFDAHQFQKATAPMHYLSGSFDPLLASISPKISEIDFGDCSPTDVG